MLLGIHSSIQEPYASTELNWLLVNSILYSTHTLHMEVTLVFIVWGPLLLLKENGNYIDIYLKHLLAAFPLYRNPGSLQYE